MRRHLGIAGIVAERGEEELAQAHGSRRIAAQAPAAPCGEHDPPDRDVRQVRHHTIR